MTGSSQYAEPARLRAVDQELTDELTRTSHPPAAGSPTRLVQTVSVTSYPSTAGKFYGVQSVTATGTEAEGSDGSISSPYGTTFCAFNIGTAVPDLGTLVLVTFVSYRWVFQYDG